MIMIDAMNINLGKFWDSGGHGNLVCHDSWGSQRIGRNLVTEQQLSSWFLLAFPRRCHQIKCVPANWEKRRQWFLSPFFISQFPWSSTPHPNKNIFQIPKFCGPIVECGISMTNWTNETIFCGNDLLPMPVTQIKCNRAEISSSQL